jgi:hypothetical protein
MLTGRACRILELVLCGFFAVPLADCSGQKFEAARGKMKPTPDSGVGIPRADTDASAKGGSAGSGGTRATGGRGEGGASNGGSDADGGTMSSGGVAGSPSHAGGAGGGSGGRAAGGALQSGGAPSTGGSHQSGGAPGGGSGGRGSGGVIQTGGASQSGGAGGGLSCSGDKCSACCDVLYPTVGGPTMTGSRIFSGQFYGCACSTCYPDCADSLCNSQDPHPSLTCLKCLYGELMNGACSTSWANCLENKVCSNFGKCAFGCL